MTRRRREALLFGGALAVRLAHVAAIHRGPVFRYLFIDSQFYDGVGRRLAAGDGFPEGPFFMNVLYGLVLGGVYAVSGSGEGGRLAALCLQCALGAAACVLTVRLGEALGFPREGLAAGLLLAVFGPAIFYDGALLTPGLLLFLTVSATLVAVRASAPAGGARAALLLGALTGLLVLGRASHALLLAGWIPLVGRGPGGARRALLVAAACAAVVLPVTLRNLAASGEWIPVSANGGMALWAGNHEQATGIYSEPPFLSNPVPEREAEDYRAEASRRAGRELTLAGSSAFWTRATLARWAADPAGAVRLAARKLRFWFHAVESQTNLSYYFARDFSPVLQVARLHLGWILPFAVLGFALRPRAFLVPAIPVAASLLTCALFYTSSEYRHPVVPCLLLFAAAGARRVGSLLRGGAPAARVAAAAALLALLVATNARDPFLSRLTSRRVDYYNFAALALAEGRLDDAERFARRSIAIDPSWPVSRAKLAEILQRAGRVDEAGEEHRRAGELRGAAVDPLEAPMILFRAGRFAEARSAFLTLAAAGGETRPLALNNAGLCAMRLERVAEAESLFTAARTADPGYASPVIHLGRLALAQGRTEAAAAYAREALALAPSDGRAHRLLARALGRPLAGAATDDEE